MKRLPSFKTGTFAQHINTGQVCFILGQNNYKYDLLWPTNPNYWIKKPFKEHFRKTSKYFSIESGLKASTLKLSHRMDNLEFIELCAKWKNHEHF